MVSDNRFLGDGWSLVPARRFYNDVVWPGVKCFVRFADCSLVFDPSFREVSS